MSLHDFQTGIVRSPVGAEAPDPRIFKTVNGIDKFRVVGRHLNIILFKQIEICDITVYFRTHGKPTDTAVGFTVVLDITAVEDSHDLGPAQIRELIGHMGGIVQRKTTAGNDIRHIFSAFSQVGVIRHRVVSDHKGEFDVGKLLLELGVSAFCRLQRQTNSLPVLYRTIFPHPALSSGFIFGKIERLIRFGNQIS